MSTTLGEKLRQAREERGISISEVAEQTRISSLYLKSIEEDNYKPLPGGIFNKGFIKAYAKYVGVDEQEALQDYARAVASNDETGAGDEPQRYRPEVLTDDRSSSSLVPTIIFAVIILGLMTGGILFVVNYIQNQPSGNAIVATNTAANNAGVATNLAANIAPTPAAQDQIKVEFRVLADKIAVTSTVDGIAASDEITAASPKTYVAQQSVKLRYYRGFADKVQIFVNGKQVTAPPPPARGNIEFEINRENVARIFESGQVVETAQAQPTPQATVAATPATTPVTPPPSNTQVPAGTPRPQPVRTPRPAFTPAPTPKKTPTPIVVGTPPKPVPSPE